MKVKIIGIICLVSLGSSILLLPVYFFSSSSQGQSIIIWGISFWLIAVWSREWLIKNHPRKDPYDNFPENKNTQI